MTNGAARPSRWILTPRSNPAARVRLVCLPHAGGGASTYFPWGAALQPHGIEVRSVQYPGREARFSEPPLTEAATLVAAMADRWDEIAGGGPCAVYGHSMGALLAFELAAELARRAVANGPRRVFVSGHQAPHLPYRAPRVHALPEAEFLPAVSSQFGGIPEELLRDPDVAALIATTLRADLTLVENYEWTGAGPLEAPLMALGGTNDPWTTEAELAGWEKHTRGHFAKHVFAGDHFFNVSHRAAVLGKIVEGLGA